MLVADDNVLNQQVLARQLGRIRGCDIATTLNGAEYVEYVRRVLAAAAAADATDATDAAAAAAARLRRGDADDVAPAAVHRRRGRLSHPARAPASSSERGPGTSTLAALAPTTVDLILMDLNMPVMDGVAAAREIRQLERVRTAAPHTDLGRDGGAARVRARLPPGGHGRLPSKAHRARRPERRRRAPPQGRRLGRGNNSPKTMRNVLVVAHRFAVGCFFFFFFGDVSFPSTTVRIRGSHARLSRGAYTTATGAVAARAARPPKPAGVARAAGLPTGARRAA